MALRKSFTKPFLDAFKTPPLHHSFHRPYLTSPEYSPDSGFFRRFLHRRAVYHSGHTRFIPEFFSLPIGDKLKSISSINPPAAAAATAGTVPYHYGISANDAMKILRVSQMEKLKGKLRDIQVTSISFSHFLRICVEACEHNEHQGAEIAKKLDESGNVIVFGNVVFLRPEQVAKTMERVISESIAHPKDRRRKELEEMKKEKEKIDEKAKALVWRELYCGMGLMMVQTIGLIRLTLWELGWDVMEPICFFLSSFYFALTYLFFLKTSSEPTFQGYFHHRFTVKQKKLMLSSNFDIHKYYRLYNACYSHPTLRPLIHS